MRGTFLACTYQGKVPYLTEIEFTNLTSSSKTNDDVFAYCIVLRSKISSIKDLVDDFCTHVR
jgi:hypothetical protein